MPSPWHLQYSTRTNKQRRKFEEPFAFPSKWQSIFALLYIVLLLGFTRDTGRMGSIVLVPEVQGTNVNMTSSGNGILRPTHLAVRMEAHFHQEAHRVPGKGALNGSATHTHFPQKRASYGTGYKWCMLAPLLGRLVASQTTEFTCLRHLKCHTFASR